jgi:fructose-bisphosphate aldolase class II
MTAAIGLVRAAERQRSPAILQLFPTTVKYGGGPFLQMCLDLYVSFLYTAGHMLMKRAHSASVPISVHLDHATDADQLELAVGLAEKGIAFDSIMVDASHADVGSFQRFMSSC